MVTPSYALFSPTILMQRLVHPIRQKLRPDCRMHYREDSRRHMTQSMQQN